MANESRGAFSFDHLVGAQQNRRRYGKTERLGGPAVHDHLELGRKLHREIVRLLAAQNAIDISGGATKVVYRVPGRRSVGEQAAVSGKDRIRIDRWYVLSAAADMIVARCAVVDISVMTRPPPGSRPRAMMASSISAPL